MKMKFVRNGRTKRRELVVASQHGETLDAKRATQLAEDLSTMLLLGYAFETQRGGSGSLQHYDVEGLWSLRTYLSKRAMSTDELMGLLRATQQVLDVCVERRLPVEGLLFDPEYVFVDAQCRPHFALILLNGVPFQARNSPLALLGALGEGQGLRYASPEAGELSRRIGDFAESQNGVFSGNTYRRFLDAEEQALGGGSGQKAVGQEPSTSSVWTSVGSTQEAGVQDGGAFFWSPLAGMVEEQAPVVPAPLPQAEPPVAPPSPMPVPTQAFAVAPAPAPAPAPSVQAAALVVPESLPMVEAAPAAAPAPVSVTASSVAVPVPVVAPPRQAWLVRQATHERYPLPVGCAVKLGRGSACDIRLRGNPKLSRVHAQLVWDGTRVQVSDLGAANGTWVGGHRLLPQQMVVLDAGQGLRLADEDYAVRIE